VARSEPGQRWRLLRWGVLALVVVHGLGVVALIGSVDRRTDHSEASLPVALWQTAIPTREKFSDRRQAELPERLRQVMDSAQSGGAELLIAPEGTLPLKFPFEEDRGIPLISGGFRFVGGQQRSSLLLLASSRQGTSSSIDKHRLVPLGEWMPSWPALAGLSAVGGLQPGEPSRFWRWGGPPAAVAICYEISNGSALAAAVADGAQWILAAANLDPYPLLLQRQFLALAQLRSLETARPLLSVANTGPTALIADRGVVEAQLPAMRPGLLPVQLDPQQGRTLYVLWRDWPLWVLLLVAVVSLWIRPRPGSGLRPARIRLRKTPPPVQG
jgi:apolipoprotein N-acyltransferase